MKTLPPIGTRVRYRRKPPHADTTRECTGTVTRHWPSYDFNDPEAGKITTPPAVSIRVDAPLPAWWPYSDTDTFAPDISTLKEIK